MIVDTHCHIQFRGLDNERDEIIARCRAKDMILNLVGTQKDSSREAVLLARRHDWMYASIGTHPNHLFPTYINEEESHFMSREEEFDHYYYEELYQSAPEKIIGVGETGLDLFHLPSGVATEVVLARQKTVFLKHLVFAEKHDLPLIIHVREAHDQMLELLGGLNRQVRGTVHCYTGNWTQAQAYLALGLHIGFTGVITFPPKKLDPAPQYGLLEVVAKMPLHKIVVETDAPYLAPQVYRGQRCLPWMVEEVIKKIAEVRGLAVDEVADTVLKNTKKLFNKI